MVFSIYFLDATIKKTNVLIFYVTVFEQRLYTIFAVTNYSRTYRYVRAVVVSCLCHAIVIIPIIEIRIIFVVIRLDIIQQYNDIDTTSCKIIVNFVRNVCSIESK